MELRKIRVGGVATDLPREEVFEARDRHLAGGALEPIHRDVFIRTDLTEHYLAIRTELNEGIMRVSTDNAFFRGHLLDYIA